MASMNPTLQLCLIHNDPLSTLLVTPDGEAMYAIHTPGTKSPFASTSPMALSPNPSASASSSTTPVPHPAQYALLHKEREKERSSTFPPPGLSSTLHPPPSSAHPPQMERSTSLPNNPLNTSTSLDQNAIATIAGLITSLTSPSPQSSAQKDEKVTTITRLERTHSFGHGHVATEIGVVNYHPSSGSRITIPLPLPPGHRETFELILPNCAKPQLADGVPCPRREGVLNHHGREEGECEHENERGLDVCQENEWEFVGPDEKRYKWQMFVQCPILLLTSPTQQHPTPLARYRRAKLGIVSKSRRASLEVFPAGMNVVDLVVVSFVGFMRRVVG